MAGIEPATPRFSGTRVSAVAPRKSPANLVVGNCGASAEYRRIAADLRGFGTWNGFQVQLNRRVTPSRPRSRNLAGSCPRLCPSTNRQATLPPQPEWLTPYLLTSSATSVSAPVRHTAADGTRAQ